MYADTRVGPVLDTAQSMIGVSVLHKEFLFLVNFLLLFCIDSSNQIRRYVLFVLERDTCLRHFIYHHLRILILHLSMLCAMQDPFDPFFLFTRPLEPHKLAAAGIVPPPDPPIENCSIELPYRFHGRMGRGGRIVFDRWNPVTHAPGRIRGSVPFVPPNSRPSPPNG